MKNKNFIIAVLLIALIAGGIYYYQNQNNSINNNDDDNTNDNSSEEMAIDIDSITLEELPEELRADLDQVKSELKQDAKNVDKLLTLAQLQKMGKDYEGGIETLKYTLSIEPDRIVTMNNLLDLYYVNKQYDEAEKMCFELIDKNILWKNAYTFLRDIYKYQMKEKYYDSDEYPNLLKAALDVSILKNDKKNLTLLLIEYYQDIDDFETAVKYCEEYLELDPDNGGIKTLMEKMKNKI